MESPSTFAPAPVSFRSRWLRIGLGVALCIPLLIVSSLLWLPTVLSYEIVSDRLAIYARAGLISHSRTVFLATIDEARPVRLAAGGIRVAGTGMPGFCAGRFHYPQLGSVWQATSCVADVVMLRVRGEDRLFLVSPAERFAFMDALRSRTPSTFPPASAGKWPLWWRLLLPLLGLLPIPILVLFLVGPARLGYRVDGGVLEVRTWLRRIRIPLQGARARRHHASRGWRLFGVRLPGYSAGWFRLDGKTTRVYATGRDGVLIEGRQRLFVTPADSDAFLGALAEAGATVDR